LLIFINIFGVINIREGMKEKILETKGKEKRKKENNWSFSAKIDK
jgi:hypothetical protein